MLKGWVNERLMAAADEIVARFERTIASYERELSRTREKERLRDPQDRQIVLNIEDVRQLPDHQEKYPPQLQGQISSFHGEVPQPTLFKEEEVEECHLRLEEADLTKFPLTVVSVKTEDHEEKPPESSELHYNPSGENREVQPPSRRSTRHMTTDVGGGSQADNLLAPLSDGDNTTSHSPENEDWEDAQEPLSSHTGCGDLFSGHPLLGTLHQPVGQSTPYPNKQCNQEEMVYVLLKEDDDAGANDFLLTKPQMLKVSEFNVVSKRILCAGIDSAPNSSAGIYTEGDRSQTQSVNTLATISYNMEVASDADQMLSEFGMKGYASPTTFTEQLAAPEVPTPQLLLGVTQGNNKAYVAVQQYSSVPLPEEQPEEPSLLRKQLDEGRYKFGLTTEKTIVKIEGEVNKNRKERKQSGKKVESLQNTKKKTSGLPSNNDAEHEVDTSSHGISKVCLRSSTSQHTTTKSTVPPGSRGKSISTQEKPSSKKTNCPQQDRSGNNKTESLRTRLTGDADNSNKPISEKPCRESLGSTNFSGEEQSSKQFTRQSNSLSGNTGLPSSPRADLTKHGLSSSETGETIAKRTRLNKSGGISAPMKLQMVRKLAKAAKAKTVAELNKSKQTKLKNTDRGTKHDSIDETGKKCISQAVWTVPARKTTSLRSPRSQSQADATPPSLSVKTPPIVPPPEPPSVIGDRLLKNQCGQCGRVLSSSAGLESHMNLHTGHRPFSCTLCRKSFTDAGGLKRHGRVHSNGRSHVCQQCGKGFVYKYGLTKHVQVVHTKIKSFVCQVCNKAFFTKLDVDAHVRIHTGEKPFHCHLCEKKFVKKVELNLHLRWHNGEKRHWCPFCGKGFFDYNNWKRHKYIHTGEKPKSCPHCPQHFTQSGHLKKHVRNVHKIQ
ncbi:zinc finger protein 37 homolog [Nerophis ophidion]|uniref:zinc finger protein 37 homolog n=1 Tax=Nerophis ophidion TaxID=159077 RepID=UPI002AE0446E|nr:zinc finger protein 37 homolog [Nerophis ophidion]